MNVNKTILAGRLIRNPETTGLNSGNGRLCKLHLAVDRNPKSAADTNPGCDLLEVQVWNNQALACSRDLQAGDEVVVDGRINVAEWHDPVSGELRKKTVINAGSVQYSRVQKPSPRPKRTPAATPSTP